MVIDCTEICGREYFLFSLWIHYWFFIDLKTISYWINCTVGSCLTWDSLLMLSIYYCFLIESPLIHCWFTIALPLIHYWFNMYWPLIIYWILTDSPLIIYRTCVDFLMIHHSSFYHYWFFIDYLLILHWVFIESELIPLWFTVHLPSLLINHRFFHCWYSI